MKNKGFILIEMIIYAGLFSILMAGLIVTAYQLSASSSSLEHKVVVQEEMNFVLKKMDWLLTGASDINVTSDQILQITKDGDFSSLKLIDSWLGLCEGSCSNDENFSPLTTENVIVENFTPEKIATNPAGILVELSINSITTDYVKYLRI